MINSYYHGFFEQLFFVKIGFKEINMDCWQNTIFFFDFSSISGKTSDTRSIHLLNYLTEKNSQ